MICPIIAVARSYMRTSVCYPELSPRAKIHQALASPLTFTLATYHPIFTFLPEVFEALGIRIVDECLNMPRELRDRSIVPNWSELPPVANSTNLGQLETSQGADAATGVCKIPSLGSAVGNRRRLRELELTAEGLEQAAVNIQDAEYGLEKRREHRRRYDDYGDESDSEDDEDASTSTRDDQILQAIMMSDRERIIQFVKTRGNESHVSIEERIRLDAADVDFDVLQQYLDTKVTRTRIRLIDIQKTFVSVFEASVKADSLPFLTGLHSAIRTYLPTEIRDMIYAYLLPMDKYRDVCDVHFQLPFFNPDFHGNLPPSDYDDDDRSGRVESELQTTTKSFQAGTEDVHQPGGWLLNPSYVGKAMARDLAEIYYSSYGFGLEMRNMHSFLHVDRTETGFKPLEHIRKELSIQVRTTMGNGSKERAWAGTDNETEFLNRIYTNLRDLLLLSHIQEIPIIITIITGSPLWRGATEGDRRFYNVMEAVREPIYDMLHAGVNLEVWHIASPSHKSRIISKGPWNFFNTSKELWHEERQSHGPSWRPSFNFITIEDCQEDTLYQLLVQRWGFTESIDSYSSRI
ncbi:unnamed protein product [Periconia digitata]|uniref:Uncharacterized protein n=1 Tax=Periconia digitata TaxID=1303443 RepID=A0A9W4XZH3_9PLEO|nr:unnamed protein product [Periconia digitata]